MLIDFDSTTLQNEREAQVLVCYLVSLMVQPFKGITVFLSSIQANMADIQHRHKSSVFCFFLFCFLLLMTVLVIKQNEII